MHMDTRPCPLLGFLNFLLPKFMLSPQVTENGASFSHPPSLFGAGQALYISFQQVCQQRAVQISFSVGFHHFSASK